MTDDDLAKRLADWTEDDAERLAELVEATELRAAARDFVSTIGEALKEAGAAALPMIGALAGGLIKSAVADLTNEGGAPWS